MGGFYGADVFQRRRRRYFGVRPTLMNGFNGADVFQRRRPLSLYLLAPSTCCFNGADVFQRRRQDSGTPAGGGSAPLQWSRRLSTSETVRETVIPSLPN